MKSFERNWLEPQISVARVDHSMEFKNSSLDRSAVKVLSDQELHLKLLDAVKEEKNLLTRILRLLREVDDRKLFSDFKCTSLFYYATKILQYSEAEAYVRINAMRLMREIPQVEGSLNSGELTLTNIAQAQNYFRRQEKQRRLIPPKPLPLNAPAEKANLCHGNIESKEDNFQISAPLLIGPECEIQTKSAKIQWDEKVAVIDKLKNCSTRQAQKVLLQLSPERKTDYIEAARALDSERMELKLCLSDDAFKKLQEVRNLLFAQKGAVNYGEIIETLCNRFLDDLQPDKSDPAKNQLRESLPNKINKSVTPKMKLTIKKRDGFRCLNCDSNFDLQVDHIHPKGLGGNNCPKNLQTLCRSCNLRRSVKSYGVRR